MTILIVSLVSLIMGLILNIFIYRIPKDDDDVQWVWPKCESCQRDLKLLEMFFPLNLFLNKGKCPKCSNKTYPRPLAVTLVTVLVNLLLLFKFQISFEFFAFSYLMMILIMVFFIDYDFFIIPDRFIVLGILGGLILAVYNIFYEFPFFMDRSWWNPLVGCLSVSLLLLIISLIGTMIYKTDAMGMGDVKLFVPIGLFLGWRMVIEAFILSAMVGGLISGILLILGKRKLKEAVPFGPFIVAGTFLTILFGKEILQWYLQFYPQS